MRSTLGILLWNQAMDWRSYEAAARRVDALGYASLWAWDHLYAIYGDPLQPVFEGYTSLAAWAKVTTRVRLGLLVGANTFRNPGVLARILTTLDHVSAGRAIAGVGAAWHELEHTTHGLEFGRGFGERLEWLEESVTALRTLLDGGTVTSPEGSHYSFQGLVLQPRPIQDHLPLLIGGAGERKTLRAVARHADTWNAQGSVEYLAHKLDVLRRHCDDVGRDFAEIKLTVSCKPLIRSTHRAARRAWAQTMASNLTPMAEVIANDSFWVGTPDLIAERMAERKTLGFHEFIGELAAPYDEETLDRWIAEVRPIVDGIES
jgi:alkanesulfonate monooxygenase SsuD/methylene tetrahydromethanopterin reductase-like flavin-dependent oxidoreductase (luciferase family)